MCSQLQCNFFQETILFKYHKKFNVLCCEWIKSTERRIMFVNGLKKKKIGIFVPQWFRTICDVLVNYSFVITEVDAQPSLRIDKSLIYQ